MDLVGKDFITGYAGGFVEYGRVVSVEGDVVTYSPCYDPRFQQEFATLSVATVLAALEETEAYDRHIEGIAKAEQAAEGAWLRAAEYDPRMDDPREW